MEILQQKKMSFLPALKASRYLLCYKKYDYLNPLGDPFFAKSCGYRRAATHSTEEVLAALNP